MLPLEALRLRFAGHAFVDWDDTIAENIRYYTQVEEANSHLIARLTGTDAKTVLARGQELDVLVARRMGLVRESFFTAWRECYLEFAAAANREPDPETIAALERSCRIPYEVRQGLLPGAAETLQWLHEVGFEITIWTAGDLAVQTRKIEESGLAHLVHRRAIVPDKTPERLLDALAGRSPAASFVVGNSAHSDIRPALALGIPAFHLSVETWGYDKSKIDAADPNYHALAALSELPAALTARFRLAV